MEMEKKVIGGKMIGFKQHEREGVSVGIIEGYGATWDLDRGDYYYRDQFAKGAFLESIQEHKDSDNRQIRYKYNHGELIGGIPIDTVREDDTGLYIEAEANLLIGGKGASVHSLARQKVIVDFSIGFSAIEYITDEDEKIRTITKARIWEISSVEEPMNPYAIVTGVKNMKQALEIHEADFSHGEALARVDDHEHKEQAYIGKYLIADVIDGELKAIPDAIFEAAGSIKKLPKEQQKDYIVVIDKYYAKMNIDSPFSKSVIIDADQAKEMSPREYERVLKESGLFSGKASKYFSSKIKKDKKVEEPEQKEDFTDLLAGIKDLTNKISKG